MSGDLRMRLTITDQSLSLGKGDIGRGGSVSLVVGDDLK